MTTEEETRLRRSSIGDVGLVLDALDEEREKVRLLKEMNAHDNANFNKAVEAKMAAELELGKVRWALNTTAQYLLSAADVIEELDGALDGENEEARGVANDALALSRQGRSELGTDGKPPEVKP